LDAEVLDERSCCQTDDFGGVPAVGGRRDTRYELLHGFPVALAPPPVAHGILAARFCGVIGLALQSRRLGVAQIGDRPYRLLT
jgi:hypothetical protein